MSEHLDMLVHNISKYCTNIMISLDIYIHFNLPNLEDMLDYITRPVLKADLEIDKHRNSVLNMVKSLNPIENLTLSMDCCLLSAALGDQDKYVNTKHSSHHKDSQDTADLELIYP